LGIALATVARKPGHRGERENKPLKPLARGMPGETGVTVVTTLVCLFYFACEAIGCVERPAFPAPSDAEGTKFRAKLARMMRRDREGVPISRLLET
jgi:hypothetical protein